MAVAEVLFVVAAMFLGAFVKGASGVGLPLLAVPVMATFLGVEHAVVVMTIPGIVTNIWLMWRHRLHLRVRGPLASLLVLGCGGAVVGTYGLKALNPRVLALALVAVIVTYVALFLRDEALHIPVRLAGWMSPPVGLAAGLLQGSTGISGPVLSTYLHALRLPKHVFVVSVATLFGAFAIMQAITLVQLGLYTAERVAQSVLALIPMMVGMPLGARLTDRMSQRSFDRFVLALLVGAAAKLLYDAIVG
jgi:uncharacterized protein